jgi:hypothetical protein
MWKVGTGVAFILVHIFDVHRDMRLVRVETKRLERRNHRKQTCTSITLRSWEVLCRSCRRLSSCARLEDSYLALRNSTTLQ